MFNSNLSFNLIEEVEQLVEITRRFANSKISPISENIDKENKFPREIWSQMGELGLHGITVPEKYGGSGLGYLAHCVAMEEISRASPAVGLSYGAHSNLCVNQISRWGTEEQKKRYLPHVIGVFRVC